MPQTAYKQLINIINIYLFSITGVLGTLFGMFFTIYFLSQREVGLSVMFISVFFIGLIFLGFLLFQYNERD